MKVADLSGADLDYWAARAEGHNPEIEGDDVWLYPSRSTAPVWHDLSPTSQSQRIICTQFHPSRNWFDGGAIIHREEISILAVMDSHEPWKAEPPGAGKSYRGPTPLIAAMRAYVAIRYGDEVPDEKEAQ